MINNTNTTINTNDPFRSSHGLPADVWGVGCMLYTLLVGRPPFDTNEVASTLNRVVAGHYLMPDHISPEAKDLLYRLLQKNPRDRISIEAVLRHAFMVKYCGNISNNNNKAVNSYHTTDSGILTMSSGGQDTSTRPPLLHSMQMQMLKRSRSEERFNPMPVLKPIFKNVLGDDNHHPPHHSHQSRQPQTATGDSLLFHGVMQQLDQFQIHPPTPSQPPNYTSSDNHVLSGIASPKTSLLAPQPPPVNIIPHLDIPPFTTTRLQPTRHRTKNAILTLCRSGEVVLEFVKYKPRFREERIVDICRISSDGQRVLLFQPTAQGGAKVSDDEPLECPPMAVPETYHYDTLPQRHWKKYVYAARFVALVRAKTPKVTYYSARAKCVLMESGTDLEMVFYEGEQQQQKVVGSELVGEGGQVKIVEGEGQQEVVVRLGVGGDPYMQLVGSGNARAIFGHFVECLRHCQLIERTLGGLEEGGRSRALFPVIIGRRPTTGTTATSGMGKSSGGGGGGGTPRTPQTLQMPSFAMSTASAGNLLTTQRQMTTQSADQQTDENGENRVGRVLVAGVGIATRYTNGNVTVEYHDGSTMCVLSQGEGGGGVAVTQAGGGMRRFYTPADELPHLVRERLAEMPRIVKQLMVEGGGDGGGYGGMAMTPATPMMRYASTGLLTATATTANGKHISSMNTYGGSGMRLHHMR